MFPSDFRVLHCTVFDCNWMINVKSSQVLKCIILGFLSNICAFLLLGLYRDTRTQTVC